MQRPETRYTRCGNVAIAYQVVGNGSIDLLYAQGWLGNIEYAWESPDYARLLTRLSRFSRLILFDKRGTGMSDPVSGAPASARTKLWSSPDANPSMDASVTGTHAGNR